MCPEFVKLKTNIFKIIDPSMQAEKTVTSDKAKKLTAIALCSALFLGITIFVTIPSILFDIFPKHYILYAIIQGSAHIVTYKGCKYVIANYKDIELMDGQPYKLSNDDFSDRLNVSKRVSDDMGGGIWSDSNRHQTMYNPIANNYDPFKD